MLQLLNGLNTGQYVKSVTGLYRSCLSDGIPDRQGLSRINVHATQAHGIRRIAHTPLPILDQNASDNAH